MTEMHLTLRTELLLPAWQNVLLSMF